MTAYSFGGPSSASGSKPGVRLREFERSHTRIRNRGAWPTTTVFSFELSKPARLVLAVRGPGPSCELAGQIRIAGTKGLNLFVFDGTIRNRPLEPGTYVLVTTENGSPKVLARSYVTIVAAGAPVKKRIRPKCAQESADPLVALTAWTDRVGALPGAGAVDDSAAPAARTDGSEDAASSSPRDGTVLGERTPRGSLLPELPIDEPTGFGLLTIALLVLFIGSLAVLAVSLLQAWRNQRA